MERAELLKKARDCAPELKCQLLEQANLLQAKQAALARLQQKPLREKENLTQAIMGYGLWQTKQQVEEGLAKLKSKTSELQALKTQLDFQRKVLGTILDWRVKEGEEDIQPHSAHTLHNPPSIPPSLPLSPA